MPEMNESQTTLRDVLAANMDAAEAGTLGQPAEAVTNTEPADQGSAAQDRVRDPQGRFAPKEQASAPKVAPEATSTPPAAEIVPVETAPQPARLTTWRKEFLPLHEKLAQGIPLTAEEAMKLADYNVQREKEYATGVSTYKAEAQHAKELQHAMEPFMADLQRHNIHPSQWIQNLGNAHRTLALGSPEQKLAMFARLAQDYGVPLPAITQAQQGQVDPTIAALMAEIQHLKQGVNTVTSRWEQQEAAAVTGMLSKFNDAEKYPHFNQVRETMAQLLESGLAQDLDSAYTKAVRMTDDVWQAEQQRQAGADAARQQADKAAAAARAKAKAGSTPSSTPSGTAATATAKDRRGALTEAFDSIGTGRV